MHLPPAKHRSHSFHRYHSFIIRCHGSPGYVFLFARAHSLCGGTLYLDAAIRCGDVVWRDGILKKGPGLCHGVSGNAFALLRLYQMTSDRLWLRRAQRFVQVIFTSEDFQQQCWLQPDEPYSLYAKAGAYAYACQGGTVSFAGDDECFEF